MIAEEDYIIFDKLDNEKLFSNEWLEVDGLGGWTSQSTACSNTRRYHGILATNSSEGRRILISQLEEWIISGGNNFPISTNKYSGAIHPEGYKLIKDISLGPAFRVRYQLEDGILTKEILKIKGKGTTLVKYSWEGKSNIEINILPLFSCRGFHNLQNRNSNPNISVNRESRGISICPWEESFRTYIEFNNAEVRDNFDWFYNFEYEEEKKRGLDYNEDLFSLVQIKLNINTFHSTYISYSDYEVNTDLSELFIKNFKISKKNFFYSKNIEDNFLRKSTKQFLINSPRNRKSIVAGYHWFEEWGRDTFITLPLILDTFEKEEDISQIFYDFLDSSNNGLIPNYFYSSNKENNSKIKAAYNSVDALLWLILASREFYNKYKNINFLKEIYPRLKVLVNYYISGTDFGISMLTNGLLRQGSKDQQLTWMDAKVNGIPVTPRSGLAVDIQALWYNSLIIMSDYEKLVGKDSDKDYYLSLAEKCKDGFRSHFFVKNSNQLVDYIDGEVFDTSFRPNQLFAFSLPHSLLTTRESRLILFEIRSRLLTPFGLRTLDTCNKNYKGIFLGNPLERDNAYHQGTVWPWLLAYYAKAVMSYAESDLREELENLVDNYSSHLEVGCLGSISEVFDGDDPHNFGGTASQAWSVAAIKYCRDLLR